MRKSTFFTNTRARAPLAGAARAGVEKLGGAVQVGPTAGWEPLLSSAIQELSCARHLSCPVSSLARFSLPQAPSRQGLRQAFSGHTGVTWAEHRHSAVQPWSPLEPTHSAPPLSLQEAWSVRAVPTRSGQAVRPRGWALREPRIPSRIAPRAIPPKAPARYYYCIRWGASQCRELPRVSAAPHLPPHDARCRAYPAQPRAWPHPW